MDEYGVQKPELKKIARSPHIPELITHLIKTDSGRTTTWLGAIIKNIETMGERSAAGLKDASGVLVKSISPGSTAAEGGLMEGDVIINCEEYNIFNISDLMSCYQGSNWKGLLNLMVIRDQREIQVLLITK